MNEPAGSRGAKGRTDELGLLRATNQRLELSVAESQRRESTATAAYNQQSAFLVTLAHELRSPLLPLRLAAQR